MYGSSFCIVTRRPRALSSRPSDDAVRPFPSEEATPPVTKMCFVTGAHHIAHARRARGMAQRRRADSSSSAACSRAVALSGVARQHAGQLDQPRLRRRGPAAVAVVAPSPVDFVTATCVSANAATCGRWVTTSTCRSLPSVASARPTATAAVPPMPASTSSNTSVGGPTVGRAFERARGAVRASPAPARRPTRPCSSGSSGDPGLAASRNVTSSPGSRSPTSTADLGRRHREVAASSRPTAVSPTARRQRDAPPRLVPPRGDPVERATLARRRARRRASRRPRARPGGRELRPGTRCTSASVSPYLRRRSCRSWRRSRTAASRSGSSLDALTDRSAARRRRPPARRRPSQPALERGERPPPRHGGDRRTERVDRSAVAAAARRRAAGGGLAMRERVGELVLLDREPFVLVGIGKARARRARRLGTEAGRSRVRATVRRHRAPPSAASIRSTRRARRRPARRGRSLRTGRAPLAGSPAASSDWWACWPCRSTSRARPLRQRRRRRQPAVRRRHGTARPRARRGEHDLVVADRRSDPRPSLRSRRGARASSRLAPPTSSSIASTIIVLPAPVSPVSAVIPGRAAGAASDHAEIVTAQLDAASAIVQAELRL